MSEQGGASFVVVLEDPDERVRFNVFGPFWEERKAREWAVETATLDQVWSVRPLNEPSGWEQYAP